MALSLFWSWFWVLLLVLLFACLLFLSMFLLFLSLPSLLLLLLLLLTRPGCHWWTSCAPCCCPSRWKMTPAMALRSSLQVTRIEPMDRSPKNLTGVMVKTGCWSSLDWPVQKLEFDQVKGPSMAHQRRRLRRMVHQVMPDAEATVCFFRTTWWTLVASNCSRCNNFIDVCRMIDARFACDSVVETWEWSDFGSRGFAGSARFFFLWHGWGRFRWHKTLKEDGLTSWSETWGSPFFKSHFLSRQHCHSGGIDWAKQLHPWEIAARGRFPSCLLMTWIRRRRKNGCFLFFLCWYPAVSMARHPSLQRTSWHQEDKHEQNIAQRGNKRKFCAASSFVSLQRVVVWRRIVFEDASRQPVSRLLSNLERPR